MASLRCFILACSLATATVAAHAGDACDGDECASIAWPSYADMVSTESDVEALSEAGDLSSAEADVITALVVRRQALRIRGLELRYLVGKTATSEGEGTDKLDHIRHQIASIEEEISYIDRELAQLLHEFGRRSGPWPVARANGACTQIWYVARPPCDGHQEITLLSAVKSHWLETHGHADPIPSDGPSGACEPRHVGLRCLAVDSDEPLVLQIDGAVLLFHWKQ